MGRYAWLLLLMMERLEKLEVESVCLILGVEVLECNISLFVVAVGEDIAVVAVDLDLIREGDLVKLMGDVGTFSPSCCLLLSNTLSQSCLISSVSACKIKEACCLG